METPLVSLLIKGDSPKELPKGQKKQPKQTITCGTVPVLDITITLSVRSTPWHPWSLEIEFPMATDVALALL